jgi:tRNA A37 N6-isopentenylltransferase MiaA
MMGAGFAEEVRQLLARGTLSKDSPALRLVGYRQLIDYCRGVESLNSAMSRALSATRQLAKRQITWLRSASLLPAGACVLHGDPFDGPGMEQIARVLIKAKQTP